MFFGPAYAGLFIFCNQLKVLAGAIVYKKYFVITLKIYSYITDKKNKKGVARHLGTINRQVIHMEVDDMALEPLGSVMSIQATQAVQTKPVVQTERSTGNNTDSAAVQEIQKMDPMLTVVQDSQQKSTGKQMEQQAKEQPSNEQIKKAVEQMNKSMFNSEAVFGIHEGTNRVTIKIVDRDTKEVIKELPPEKTLDMIAKVWEMAGILVDERR